MKTMMNEENDCDHNIICRDKVVHVLNEIETGKAPDLQMYY